MATEVDREADARSNGAEAFLGELRLSRPMTSWRHLMGSVALGLLGLAVAVGPYAVGSGRAPWAVLGMALLMGLALASLIELQGGAGERGGTYALTAEIFGGWAAFLVGWGLLAANVLVAAAVAQAAAAVARRAWWPGGSAEVTTAGVVLATLTLSMMANRWHRRARDLAGALAAVGGIVVVIAVATSPMPDGAIGAMAWSHAVGAGRLMLGYLVVDMVLMARRQMRDPSQQIPKGLLAAGLAWTVFASIAVAMGTRFLVPQPVSGSAAWMAVRGWRGAVIAFWLVGVLAATASLLWAAVARQLHALSRDGVLPRWLRWVVPGSYLPLLLFLIPGAAAIPLAVNVPSVWLIDTAAGLVLFAVLGVSAAAIHSRRTQPERRRAFVVPLHPLGPLMALALAAMFLWALPVTNRVAAAIWLAGGGLLYAAYGRRHHVAAQEGVLTFGRPEALDQSGRREAFRILIPLGTRDERRSVLRLGAALARQMDGALIPLQVIPVPDPLAIEEGRRLARARNERFQWLVKMAEDYGVPVYPITRLATSVSEGILDSAVDEACDLILIPWDRDPAPRAHLGRVLDTVIRRAACDVAVLAGRRGRWLADGEEPLRRLLVPAVGGPNAPLALRMAFALAREWGAQVRLIYVVDEDADEEERAAAEERLAQALEEAMAGDQPDQPSLAVEKEVIAAPDVVTGLVEAGADCDLVLMGASEESIIDQVLLGSIPEQVARRCPSPVLIVRRYRGLRHLWLQQAWEAVYTALPTITRDEQIEVYKAIRRGARPDADFFVMMGLATLIATLGLMQNSAAVIIGAMLVAPLFTPILALSLGIVHGDGRLLRLALEAAIKGIALAVALSWAMTVLTPGKAATGEILARTHPNLLDLAVALASGAAGAYAVARKDVSASLPGVAIAAALVPPLGVVGFGLGIGDLDISRGAGLLFATNLTAITFAGAIMFLLLGFRPAPRTGREARLRAGLLITLALLVAVMVPLAWVFFQSVADARLLHDSRQTLTQTLAEISGAYVGEVAVEMAGEAITIRAVVYLPDVSGADSVARAARQAMEERWRRPVRLELQAIEVATIQANP
ncbi:MAG: hypothetical protein Kow0047_28050 [Anaerolineae bacterium]